MYKDQAAIQAQVVVNEGGVEYQFTISDAVITTAGEPGSNANSTIPGAYTGTYSGSGYLTLSGGGSDAWSPFGTMAVTIIEAATVVVIDPFQGLLDSVSANVQAGTGFISGLVSGQVVVSNDGRDVHFKTTGSVPSVGLLFGIGFTVSFDAAGQLDPLFGQPLNAADMTWSNHDDDMLGIASGFSLYAPGLEMDRSWQLEEKLENQGTGNVWRDNDQPFSFSYRVPTATGMPQM